MGDFSKHFGKQFSPKTFGFDKVMENSPDYLKETMKNPTMDKIMQSIMNFKDDKNIDDPDLAEI